MEWASAAYTAAALACATAACVVALVHIYRHLLHYAEPIYQRFIVRIIFMVPVMLSARQLVYLTLAARWGGGTPSRQIWRYLLRSSANFPTASWLL